MAGAASRSLLDRGRTTCRRRVARMSAAISGSCPACRYAHAGYAYLADLRRNQTMIDNKTAPDWGEEFWYSGKVTRRRLIGYGAAAGALGATMLVPAPWQRAFGQAKPYKVGTSQPLSGAAAAGGKPALV